MMEEVSEPKKTTQRRKETPWYNNKFYHYALGILLVLLIIFVFYQVAFLLTPILNFFSSIITPVIISYIFYYLLRPLVYGLEKIKIPRYVSILLIYVVIALMLVFFFAYLGPILRDQITALADMSVETIDKIKVTSKSIFIHIFNMNMDKEIEQRLLGFAQQITTLLSQNFVSFVGVVTRVATILAVIPFIVFYLLKDDENFAEGFLYSVPQDFGREVRKILHNIDTTLSGYVNSLVLVSMSLGALLFIGYMIIGLNYALILSIIAIIFTTIPFLGPFLAITPALLVALSDSPFMVFKVVIVFVIIQQLESNVISPQIIGQRLHIHPLTLILLLLAAGTLYGLIGLILVTPLYAMSKVLMENCYKIYQLRFSHWKKEKLEKQ